MPYLNKDMKALAVSYDGGKNYVAPSVANVKNKTYPIARPLYYYYLTSDADKVASFIQFSLSPAGQQIAEEVGFIGVD